MHLGIDPGLAGGMALLDPAGRVVDAVKMPRSPALILAWLRKSKAQHAVLEFVRSSPQMGVVSAFTFGRGFGGLEMALTAAGIPYRTVLPLVWQLRIIGAGTKGNKNLSKAHAGRLFGGEVKVTHAIADALLIAEYGRVVELRCAHARAAYSSTRNRKGPHGKESNARRAGTGEGDHAEGEGAPSGAAD